MSADAHARGLHLHRYGGEGAARYVALHGWAGTHRTFEAVAPHLPPAQPMLAMDMPGYGLTPDPARWHLDDLVAQMVAGLEGRLDGPCTLVGNCSGAVLALLLWEARPAWFERVVLVEPFAFTPWYFRLFTLPLLGRFFYWNAFENLLGRWITDLALRDQDAQTGTDLLQGFRETRATTALGHLRLIAALQDPRRFAGLRAPVTLVSGDRTLAAVKASVKIWQEIWPHARHVEVQDAGHLLLQEQPRAAASSLFNTPSLDPSAPPSAGAHRR
jgi:pimeloyl-ACP methyl ester carboxylesterase